MSNNIDVSVVSVHEIHKKAYHARFYIIYITALVIMAGRQCLENSLSDYIEASSYHVKI